MKKITIFISILAVLSCVAFAQQRRNANRMILTNKVGEQIVYPTDDLDNIIFTETNDVTAAVEVVSTTYKSISVKVAKSEECKEYLLVVLPAMGAPQGEDLVEYIKTNGTKYDADFEGELMGVKELTDYLVATLAYDQYGIDCEIQTAAAKTLSSVADAFADGDGSVESPYLIADGSQLRFMQQKVNARDDAYVSANYKLTANIDLENLPWTPIGTGEGNDNVLTGENNTFKGTFDGAGFTVSGLNCEITGEGNVFAGLFGFIYGGSVSNVTVKGNVKAIGTLASVAAGVAAYVYSGTIDGCAFEGSVVAGSLDYKYEIASAGGVVALIQVTAVKNSSVNLPADNIIAAYAASANAGGVVANGYSGSIDNCSADVAGNIEAQIPVEAVDASLQAVAGAISGNNFGAVLSTCKANISGSILVNANGSTSAQISAGGASATNSADAYGHVDVYLSGSIKAIDGRQANAAGGIGSVQGGYGVTAVNVTMTETAVVSAIAGPNGGAYAGGVVGVAGALQGGGAGSNLHADVAGEIHAEGDGIANVGGVSGSAPLTKCSAVIRSSAKLSAKSTTYAIVGGVLGQQVDTTVKALYAIVDGELTVDAGESARIATIGGVIGSVGASRTKKRYIQGCYSIINGKFVDVNERTTTVSGALAGDCNNFGTLTSCYWYSSNADIAAATGGGVTTGQLAGTTEADFTEAISSMNSTLSSESDTYQYDTEKGYPVFVVAEVPAE